MPAFVLKKMIMNNFTTQVVDEDIADSIDFMVERVSRIHVVNKQVVFFRQQHPQLLQNVF